MQTNETDVWKLVCRHRGILRKYISRHPEDEDDVLQEAALIMIVAIREGRIRQPEHIRIYAATVVKFVAMRLNQARTRLTSIDGARGFGVHSSERWYARKEKMERVQGIVRTMEPRRIEIIQRMLRGETPQEIMDGMNLTASQERNLKHQTLGMIRARIEKAARKR